MREVLTLEVFTDSGDMDGMILRLLPALTGRLLPRRAHAPDQGNTPPRVA
jgi:hypothetical protein